MWVPGGTYPGEYSMVETFCAVKSADVIINSTATVHMRERNFIKTSELNVEENCFHGTSRRQAGLATGTIRI